MAFVCIYYYYNNFRDADFKLVIRPVGLENSHAIPKNTWLNCSLILIITYVLLS